MENAIFFDYDSVFSSRLRSLIEEKNISKQKLADEIGVSRQAISQYCDGSTVPNADKLLKIAEYFNVSLDYLVGNTESKTPINTDEGQLIRSICDYTGLSEKAVKTLNGKSGTLGELRSYKKSKYILDYLICVDTHFSWKANLYKEKSENFLEQCEHIKKECENYTAESTEAKIIEFIADEKVVRYAYLDAVESAKEFLDHTIRPYRDCLEKKQEILNILYRMADENEEGEPNGNDNEA